MADEKDPFFSFEKALEELRLKEDELKRLVSEGEIRAFRDEDKMKFRREDIERLKEGSEPVDFTKDSTDASAETLADDLVFDDDDLDLGDDEPGMQTAPIDETLEDDLGLGGDEPAAEEDLGEISPAHSRSRRSSTSGRVARLRGESEVLKESDPVMTAILVVCSLVLFMGVFVAMDLFHDTKGGISAGIADFFGENFTE